MSFLKLPFCFLLAFPLLWLQYNTTNTKCQ
nr:MAG TPA: hypothetical protein [Caudoviricetes sp.]